MENKTKEDYWREYEHLTGLYKTYLSVIVSLGVFSFAAIGGIASYALHQTTHEVAKLILLFPFVFSVGLTILYSMSYIPAKQLNQSLQLIGKKQLSVELPPHSFLLVYGVILLALLYALISCGIAIVLYNPEKYISPTSHKTGSAQRTHLPVSSNDKGRFDKCKRKGYDIVL